jgi:hypothetical protein
MPDKKAQLKFDADYCQKLLEAITKVGTIYNRIKPKDRTGRWSKFNSLNNTLVAIKAYAYINTGVNPPSDKGTVIKHDEKSLVRVRNAKEFLKTLYGSLVGADKGENKQNHAFVLDILNRFEDYLEKKQP